MSEWALMAIIAVSFLAGGLAGVVLTALMVQSGRMADAEDDEVVRRMIEEGQA